jgi:protein-disulfide isomerase
VSKWIDHASTALLLVACALLSALVGTRLWNERTAPGGPSSAVEDLKSAKLIMSVGASAHAGRASADLTLIEFSDFECPYCGKHVKDTYPELQREYIETGRLNYVFRNLPLQSHSGAMDAAKAAECAGSQGRYTQSRELLFASQTAPIAMRLSDLATSLNLDKAQFEQCVQGSTISVKVAADRAEAHRLSIRSTPTFLVGLTQSDGSVKIVTKITGARPFSVFKEVIEEAIKLVASPGALRGPRAS